MDIIVKGRHTDVNERFRQHVDGKLAKIERLDQKVIRVDVEVSEEHNPRLADRRERVEITIRSRGPVIRAEAAAEDRYGALDLAMDKLESRLRRAADRRKAHRNGGNRAPAKLAAMEPLPEPMPMTPGSGPTAPEARTAEETRPEEPEPAAETTPAETPSAETAGNLVPIPMDGDGPVVVREKFHKSAPMTIDQALYEMELVGHDFFLFRDKDSGHPSVVYRRRGWDYGVIRLLEE
ncbi:ribosome hibernation-promoting factor, HPF/YfiA family [Thermomonospora catenispora]|uniref:ribosome hibernation-promoting factor, HPF/YfiA family n=1 Tax=Thermomonospora catenispora TaxID=2493090 RepID=UPI001122C65E|nr:ribosome-associated translation inhibitor RaiA [Thermomonospora catenispora]TNY35544.1 ribosome-associated translation inhibitor RaiA [Thermomonospora catenispora]